MVLFPCLAVGFFMHLVAVLFTLVCAALILIVLIQKGRGGGLSSAFGGGGGGSGLLGSKTGDFLTWVTIGLACVFLLLAVCLAKFYKPTPGQYGVEQQQPAQHPMDANPAAAPEATAETPAPKAELPAPAQTQPPTATAVPEPKQPADEPNVR